MGKRGPLAKPPGVAQGHRGRSLTLVGTRTEVAAAEPGGSAVPATIPAPPAGLLAATREAWDTYWGSPVASVALPSDGPAIRRLFGLYDQHERAMKVARKALVVEGSTGQPRVNPVADYALKLEGAILRLENELGLTPLSRARLGIAVGEATLTAAEINRMAEEPDDVDADPAEVELLEAWEAAE